MDGIALMKFTLIAFALPAQYFLMQHWSNNAIEQSNAFTQFTDSLTAMRTNYFELDAWKKWYVAFIVDLPIYKEGKAAYLSKKKKIIDGQKKENLQQQQYRLGAVSKVEYDDALAIEVLTYRQNLKHFAESSKLRSPRPDDVLYRVGQVVKHKKYDDLYGVIIGWDEKVSAPNTWIERNYGQGKDDQEIRQTFASRPHYLILVDERSQNKYREKAYVVESEIEIVESIQVKHRALPSYFDHFNGDQYLPKKYLKTVYPHDNK